jgi:hypothetical protein
MSAPGAAYRFHFRPDPKDEWNGILELRLNGQSAVWRVFKIEEEDGVTSFGGVTEGDLVGDGWWFEFRPKASPPLIRYWGDQVVVREDEASVWSRA